MPNDPAITWLSTLSPSQSPADNLLAQAGRLLRESGQLKPPFDPRKATPTCVKKVETAILNRDGMLIPVDGGFLIRLNSDRPLVRQKFACAHEIGHTFFYDTSGPRPWRPAQSLSSYWAEEALCYQFAEEMLMPSECISKIGFPLTPTLKSFMRLKQVFGVSAESLARRIARLNLWHFIFIIFANSKTPSLQPKTVCKHADYKHFTLNWDTLIRNASSSSASVTPVLTHGRELFRRGGQREQWQIECYRSDSGASQSLLVMITPEPVSAKTQLPFQASET